MPSARVYAQKFLMTRFAYTDVKYTAGERSIGLILLRQVLFFDLTEWQVFTLSIFSMTSVLVVKLAAKLLNKCTCQGKNWQSGAYRRANETWHNKTCHRKFVRV